MMYQIIYILVLDGVEIERTGDRWEAKFLQRAVKKFYNEDLKIIKTIDK